MSVTWDTKSLKATPVALDEVLVIDTADLRNQKRATLSSFGATFWSRNAGVLSPSTTTDSLAIDTDTLFVNAGADTVSIGNLATLTDLTIFQSSDNAKKGITLSGSGM